MMCIGKAEVGPAAAKAVAPLCIDPARDGKAEYGTGDGGFMAARGTRRILFAATVTGAYALVLAPVLAVVLISFFAQEIVSFPPEGWTLRWYTNAWEKREFARGFLTSMQVALAATAIGVPLGTAAALALARGRLPAREAFNTLLLAPLAVPGVVAGTALYLFYVRAEFWVDDDIKGTTLGLVAAHVLLTIPWTVRLVSASLAGLDRLAEEAAANLGARPLTVFRRVTLPMLRPGVVAACLFSSIQSFENLELTLLLVGPGRITLPVAMLNYLEFRVDPTLAAVASVQIVIVGALMLITDRFVSLSRVV
jgi:putative spermidine/putrescine transport system permease protein